VERRNTRARMRTSRRFVCCRREWDSTISTTSSLTTCPSLSASTIRYPLTLCHSSMAYISPPLQQNLLVCSTGFPMGCYVDEHGRPHDACVLDRRFNKKNSYYLFNHLDIEILYRDMTEDPNFFDEQKVN